MSMETMRQKLLFRGGFNSIDRINKDKLKSLRLALKGDQHSRRVKTPEKECWYGLINDNKLTADYDRKIFAIEKDAHLKAGDVFEVLDDGSHWMVYLPFLSETAFFKTEIIRCRYTIDLDGTTYWIYFQGPTETSASWFIKDAVSIANMNLKSTVYIKKDNKTDEFFNRFKKIKIAGQTWEIQATDRFSVPGIIEAVVKETNENPADDIADVLPACPCDQILGQSIVEQDGEFGFEIRGDYLNDDSEWRVDGNPRVRISSVTENGRFVKVKVYDGAVDGFTLKYGTNDSWFAKKVFIKHCQTPIVGETVVSPYDVVEYKVRNEVKDGTFYVDGIDSKHAKVVAQKGNSCKVEITASRTCDFLLKFRNDDGCYFEQKIEVRSL